MMTKPMLAKAIDARAKNVGAALMALIDFSMNPTPIAPRVHRTRLLMAVADAGLEGYRSIMRVELMLKMAVAVKAAGQR